MRRWLLRFTLLVAVVALVVTVRRRRSAARVSGPPIWPPLEDGQPDARWAPPAASPIPEDVPPSKRWSEPEGKECPLGFTVKVKLASGIYHLPGMFAYDRTIPDRCYASAKAAEADGFRAAKR